MKFKSLIYIVSALILSSCATHKSVENTNVLSIEFGYSGGFANQHTKKVLDYTGCLYEIADNDTSLLCNVDKDTVRNLFKEASSLDKPFRHPGNISYYIVVKKRNEEMKWVWSHSTSNADSLWLLYRKLNELK